MTEQELVLATGCRVLTAQRWIAALNDAMFIYGIDTPRRQAHFIAQCAHESGLFERTEENLNYSAEALVRVFPRHFKSLEEAQPYHRQPQAIANKVYANRMGNGPPESGDGWRYRGRGLIQLTGRDNYAAYQDASQANVLVQPAIVAEAPHAALSAGWFWERNGLNGLADANDVVAVTRRINGGTNGLEHRRKLTVRALAVLDKQEVNNAQGN